MIKYDDLLNIPYRHGGRDKSGYDCYGLVLECCRRNGTPIKDPTEECTDENSLSQYIKEGLNVREIPFPKVGCIVETMRKGTLHVGFLADRNTVVHSRPEKGVKTSALLSFQTNDARYYEVTNESNNL